MSCGCCAVSGSHGSRPQWRYFFALWRRRMGFVLLYPSSSHKIPSTYRHNSSVFLSSFAHFCYCSCPVSPLCVYVCVYFVALWLPNWKCQSISCERMWQSFCYRQILTLHIEYHPNPLIQVHNFLLSMWSKYMGVTWEGDCCSPSTFNLNLKSQGMNVWGGVMTDAWINCRLFCVLHSFPSLLCCYLHGLFVYWRCLRRRGEPPCLHVYQYGSVLSCW